ncbi:MAG: hypothetical protein KC680_01860 [Candidatus Peregrinibacteria bacterium]|nr:hypothetical protein [Candidatus Peregrinibacteria bacterium]MCB9808206.1 hypothetical protein [Candidatus Peribacteria bacterium]
MWFLQICGMVIGALMIKYREKIGEQIGEAEWMRYVGGVYNFVILLGILFFFWSLAALTGTMDIFFAPLFWLVGGAFQ